MTGIHIRKEETQTHIEGRGFEGPQGEHRVKTEAEIGTMHLPAKGCRRLLTTPEATRKAWNPFSLPAFRVGTALPTPWLWTSHLQNFERINFCCFKAASMGTLLQQPQEINTVGSRGVQMFFQTDHKHLCCLRKPAKPRRPLLSLCLYFGKSVHMGSQVHSLRPGLLLPSSHTKCSRIQKGLETRGPGPVEKQSCLPV